MCRFSLENIVGAADRFVKDSSESIQNADSIPDKRISVSAHERSGYPVEWLRLAS